MGRGDRCLRNPAPFVSATIYESFTPPFVAVTPRATLVPRASRRKRPIVEPDIDSGQPVREREGEREVRFLAQEAQVRGGPECAAMVKLNSMENLTAIGLKKNDMMMRREDTTDLWTALSS